jgi:hypothetical protein
VSGKTYDRDDERNPHKKELRRHSSSVFNQYLVGGRLMMFLPSFSLRPTVAESRPHYLCSTPFRLLALCIPLRCGHYGETAGVMNVGVVNWDEMDVDGSDGTCRIRSPLGFCAPQLSHPHGWRECDGCWCGEVSKRGLGRIGWKRGTLSVYTMPQASLDA